MRNFFRYKAGAVDYYDKSYDRITTRNEIPLEVNNKIFHKVTTTDDPVIRKVCDCLLVYRTKWLRLL